MEIESIANHAGKLSPSGQVFARLSRVLRNPDSGIDDVVGIIHVDTALTATLIRSSNSVIFGSRGIVVTLEEAINRLGFREVHRLVGAIASRQMHKRVMNVYQLTPEDFWRLSVASALAMEILSFLAHDDPSHGYTLGLLHSIGLYSMDLMLGEVPDLVTLPSLGDHEVQAQWERDVVGFDHAEASAYLLRQWKLPPDFVEPIRWHVRPEDALGFCKEACLLHLAVTIGRSRIDPERRPPKWRPAILEGAGLRQEVVTGIIPDVVSGMNLVSEKLRA